MPRSCKRASPIPPTARRIYQIDMETGAEGYVERYPTPDELWAEVFAEAERLARPLRRRSVRGARRHLADALLPAQRHRERAGGDRRRQAAHPADARHRHRQDRDRLPDRLDAVPEPLEPVARADAAAAHPVPRRPQHPGRSGLQRLLGLSRGRAGAHQAGRNPQERPRAEERQRLLHDLPDLHERDRRGRASPRPISATIRRTSSTSSSSTSAIAAAPTTRATGAAFSNISRRPCSSA